MSSSSTATSAAAPVVWLAAGIGEAPVPKGTPVFRDDQMRIWRPDPDGARYHTLDGRHHLTKDELHRRSDLQVIEPGGLASGPLTRPAASRGAGQRSDRFRVSLDQGREAAR